MVNYSSEYVNKTKGSYKLFIKSKVFHVNGVSHNIRFFKPYPFITKYSKGKFIVDVDHNKYTDYWMGHWSLIFGHVNTYVKQEIRKQLARGWMYGTVNEITIKLSELIRKSVPIAEKIRYVTTGTEAAMYAVRLARSTTNKKIIAKIDGGWHGYTSDLLRSINWPFSKSECNGLVNEKYTVSLPFNNIEKSIKILTSIKDDLAGIIIEPVLGGGGCIPATKEYLLGIQEFIHSNNSIFILDEIVTGFRFKFGCMYHSMKLRPDIVILGKIVGGGLPIGIICGTNEIMNNSNTEINKKPLRAYIGGGTFSTNPLTMISGHATLTLLKSKKVIYEKINQLGEKTRRMLNKIFEGKAIVTGKGSLFMIHFIKNNIQNIKNATDVAKCDKKVLYDYHFKLISHDNIFFMPGKLGAFSYAHSDSDIKHLINASTEFAEVLN